MSTVISIEHLSKSYRLGAIGGGTLQEDLSRWWARMRSKPDPTAKIGAEHHPRHIGQEFWALRDISFEVRDGEILGIIGRNGAGKSTLLKILSRVTGPTSGYVKIKGRIASLLEVGTGFHPELTGRENVFLNGTILGMTKAEIRKKFDEIVAFAEIDEFIDTPVKRYSSGMYVRLAFAVAAHLEPEILIADEVLAVGDTQFQTKCLDKMRSIREEGRAVIFVSHNLSTVRSLCNTAILIKAGRLIAKDESSAVIARYLSEETTESGVWKRTEPLPAIDGVYVEEITLSAGDGTPVSAFDSDQTIKIVIKTRCTRSCENVQINLRITNQEGFHVFGTANTDASKSYVPIPLGENLFSIEIPALLLPHGRYSMQVRSHIPHVHTFDFIDGKLSFFVHDVGSHATILKDDRGGIVNPLFSWRMQSS